MAIKKYSWSSILDIIGEYIFIMTPVNQRSYIGRTYEIVTIINKKKIKGRSNALIIQINYDNSTDKDFINGFVYHPPTINEIQELTGLDLRSVLNNPIS